jgi:hypothetical protein
VGISSAVLNIPDTTAAFFGVIAGPLIVLFGVLLSDASWDRWYGSDGREGRLYHPLLKRLPRSAGRALLVVGGLGLTFSGILLFALGRV